MEGVSKATTPTIPTKNWEARSLRDLEDEEAATVEDVSNKNSPATSVTIKEFEPLLTDREKSRANYMEYKR